MSAIPSPDRPIFEARALRLATSIGAAALFAFGVLCWVAANWSTLHRLTRIEMVGGLLLASAAAAVLAPRARTPALLVAVAAVGGLLAVIGQAYPSGADAWRLFAWWALLALPFALAARHDATWTLWTIVAGAAIALWRAQDHPGPGFADFAPAWALSIALAAMLAPRPATWPATWPALARGDARWAFRLAGLLAVAMVAQGGLHGLFMSATRGDAALAAAIATLAAAAAVLMATRPLELGVLAMAAGGLDALLIGRLAKALDFDRSSVPLANYLLMAVAAAGIVGGSVALLRSAHLRTSGPADAAEAHPQAFSWPLAALAGFGALLAAIPFLALYALAFETLLRTAAGAAVLGAATLGAAVLLLRGGAPFGFRQIFGMIAAAVGLGLIVYAVLSSMHAFGGFALAVFALGLAWAVTPAWARALFGWFAMWALIGSIVALSPYGRLELALTAISLLTAGCAAGLVAAGPAGAARPSLAGSTAAGLFALVMFAGRPFLVGAGSGLIGGLGSALTRAWEGPAQAASILLALAGAASLLARRADLRTPLGYAVAAVIVALSVRAPTLGAIVAVFAGAMLANARGLAGAALVAAIWSVSALYYSLSWTLAAKGFALMGMGAALGATALATRPVASSSAAAAAAPAPVGANGGALALIAMGVVLVSLAAGQAVRASEKLLAEGRRIYIPLRPVDPRSLVQGDYMALAFDTGALPDPGRAGDGRALSGPHVAVAAIDARGVAKFVALDAPPAQGQVPVQIRVKNRRWFVGSDAWYFEEGRAQDYGGAKFGQFRLGEDGRLLLTGMADENLRPLP